MVLFVPIGGVEMMLTVFLSELPRPFSCSSVYRPSILSFAMHLIIKPFADILVSIWKLIGSKAISFSSAEIPREFPSFSCIRYDAFSVHQVIEKISLVDSELLFVYLPSSSIKLAVERGPCFEEALLTFPHKQTLAHWYTYGIAAGVHAHCHFSVVYKVNCFYDLRFNTLFRSQ